MQRHQSFEGRYRLAGRNGFDCYTRIFQCRLNNPPLAHRCGRYEVALITHMGNSHLVRDQNWFFKVNFKSAPNYSKLTV